LPSLTVGLLTRALQSRERERAGQQPNVECVSPGAIDQVESLTRSLPFAVL